MARQVSFKDVIGSFQDCALQLGATLVHQELNQAELKANAQEHRRDLRRWHMAKSRKAHSFFLEENKRRRQNLVHGARDLETLVGNLREELRETRRRLLNLQVQPRKHNQDQN